MTGMLTVSLIPVIFLWIYHIEQSRGEQIALIYDSPVTQQKQQFTYNEFTVHVANLADVLRLQYLEKGDRVLIYMPMIPRCSPVLA
ncbi:MAG: propionyl-CoA synthetase [Paraglaciecola sp.]|jgi:propionyl-CoA synthetase